MLNLLALDEIAAVVGGAVLKVNELKAMFEAVWTVFPPSLQAIVMSVLLLAVGIPPPKQFIW